MMTEAVISMLCERLESAYSRIQHERMADVPMLNPKIRVRAVGFQREQLARIEINAIDPRVGYELRIH